MQQQPRAAGRARRRTAWEIQRAVLFALVLREMKQRVGGQWVGAVWTVLEPLAHALLIVSILGFMRDPFVLGVEFPVFLVTGLIPYFFFQNLTLRMMDAVEANRGVFAYRQVKPMDALLSRAIVESLMNLLVYFLTLGTLAWLGFGVLPARPLELLALHVLIGLFGLSAGILAAVAAHGRPRMKSFVRMAFMPLYFASGVLIPLHLLPREYLDWLLLNPVMHLVELSRYSFIAKYQAIEGVSFSYPLAWTLIMMTAGLALYRINRLRLIASS